MGTMVKVNDSITCVDGKALTVMKLKELGSKAERKAQGLYDARGDSNIQLDQAVLSTQTDAMIPDNQLPAKVCPSLEELWWSLLPNGHHIISMDPDGNCLFCSFLDQLNHDNGQVHDFTCYQITNHICRHSDEFKEFLLLQDNHEDISNLDSYIHKMSQNGKWGGDPELYNAAWFYGVNIAVYSPEYTNTNGMLIINADGHQGAIDGAPVMWTISFHSSNQYNSIGLPGNPPLPIRHIMNVQRYQSYLQQVLDKYPDNLTIIALMLCTKGHPIPTIAVQSLRKTTGRMMSYIALQILSAGGDAILESHLKSLLSQAKEGVMKSVQGGTAVRCDHRNTIYRKSSHSAVCGRAQGNH